VGTAGLEAVLAHGNSSPGQLRLRTVWEELVCAFNAVLSIARGGRMNRPRRHDGAVLHGRRSRDVRDDLGAPCGTVKTARWPTWWCSTRARRAVGLALGGDSAPAGAAVAVPVGGESSTAAWRCARAKLLAADFSEPLARGRRGVEIGVARAA